jgi:hypothetical protein
VQCLLAHLIGPRWEGSSLAEERQVHRLRQWLSTFDAAS